MSAVDSGIVRLFAHRFASRLNIGIMLDLWGIHSVLAEYRNFSSGRAHAISVIHDNALKASYVYGSLLVADIVKGLRWCL